LCSKRAKEDPWLAKLLATKERKVAACALANKACPGEGRGRDGETVLRSNKETGSWCHA